MKPLSHVFSPIPAMSLVLFLRLLRIGWRGSDIAGVVEVWGLGSESRERLRSCLSHPAFGIPHSGRGC